jgi:hypothetical protein
VEPDWNQEVEQGNTAGTGVEQGGGTKGTRPRLLVPPWPDQKTFIYQRLFYLLEQVEQVEQCFFKIGK